jgi:putative hemolysin
VRRRGEAGRAGTIGAARAESDLSPSLPVGPLLCALASAVLGSLFAAGDAALSTLSEARLETLLEGKGPNVEAFRRYSKDRMGVLSRWLVGRIVSISLSAALVDEAVERYPGLAGFGFLVAVFVAVGTYGTFTEVFATMARRRPETFGAFALRALGPLEWGLVPLAAPLASLGRVVARHVPVRPTHPDLAESEVEWMVAQGERMGTIPNEPAEIIRNVLDFKDTVVKSVMVPRSRMSAFEVNTPLSDVMGVVAKEGHSRYPVYRETLDNIVGLLYAKDLFRIVREGRIETTKLESVLRINAHFAVETQPAATVLRQMRARGMHVAVVVDDSGGTSGIVTLEDILEEIVGDLREHDRAPQIQQIGEGRFVADAAVSLTDLSDRLGKPLPADGEFESLGGLIVHRAGKVPEVGSELTVDGLRFLVREARDTHVVKVEIEAVPHPEPNAVPTTTS